MAILDVYNWNLIYTYTHTCAMCVLSSMSDNTCTCCSTRLYRVLWLINFSKLTIISFLNVIWLVGNIRFMCKYPAFNVDHRISFMTRSLSNGFKYGIIFVYTYVIKEFYIKLTMLLWVMGAIIYWNVDPFYDLLLRCRN